MEAPTSLWIRLARSGLRPTGQIICEPFQGGRQLLVFEVPERPTRRVFAEEPDRGHELAEPHSGQSRRTSSSGIR